MTENSKNKFQHLQGVELKTENELDFIEVNNDSAEASIFLQGAQVGTFQKKGQSPTLFLSDNCTYKKGFALRGGIPICWPWFGDLDQNSAILQKQFPTEAQENAPAHGFVRDREWKIDNISTPSENLTIVDLSIIVADGESLLPFATSLLYRIEVSNSLKVILTVKNLSEKGFVFTQALHTYFDVNNTDKISIKGLNGISYLDKLDDALKQQHSDITITEETDKVYDASPTLTLVEDNKVVELSSRGAQSTIVWNPWVKKGANLSQFRPADYRKMVCIESGNALDHYVALEPRESHTLSITIKS